MNKRKSGLIIALIAAIMLFAMPACAAASKSKALKAYKKFLSKTTVRITETNKVPSNKVRFATALVDGDNVPELIVDFTKTGWSTVKAYQIYTFKKGKMKEVGSGYTSIVRLKGYYPKKNVITASIYGGTVYMTLSAEQSLLEESDKAPKKAVGKTKKKKLKFYKNTAKNRKKRLK